MTLFDGYFKYANIESPITDSLANSTLKDMDPALYAMMRFYNNIINIHMLSRWNEVVTNLGMTDLVDKIVAQVEGIDCFPYATDSSFQFPLLSIYRQSEKYGKRTTTWSSIEAVFELIYILPPLTVSQYKVLFPFLTHIARTVQERTAIGLDSFYEDGRSVWWDIQIDKIGCSNTSYGKIPNESSDLFQPCFSMNIEMWERSMPINVEGVQYPPLTAIHTQVQNKPSDVDEAVDIADFDNTFE